jgi:hypothetical protein
MFGSDVLDVGIGMSLLFLMMSLIATSIREAIEGLMKSRAKDLENGLREMLNDNTAGNFDGLVGQIYKHPLISSLYRGTLEEARSKKDLPSYIPSKAFVSALFDIMLSSSPAKAAPQANAAAPADPIAPEGKIALPQSDRKPLTLESLKASANNLPAPLKTIVLAAIDEGQKDIDAVRKSLEGWFDSTMDRVSGWYRRRTQGVLFLIGIVGAVCLNVDSITITQRLTIDKTLREAIVATAQTPGNIPAADSNKSYDVLSAELGKIGYPIGWREGVPEPQMCTDDNTSDKPSGVKPETKPGEATATKSGDETGTKTDAKSVKSADKGCSFKFSVLPRTIAGWFVTAFAIMLGAPFWFDVLNKFMVVRSTIKPHEKSKEEASKDNPAEPAGVKLTIATDGNVSAAAVAKPAVGSG